MLTKIHIPSHVLVPIRIAIFLLCPMFDHLHSLHIIFRYFYHRQEYKTLSHSGMEYFQRPPLLLFTSHPFEYNNEEVNQSASMILHSFTNNLQAEIYPKIEPDGFILFRSLNVVFETMFKSSRKKNICFLYLIRCSNNINFNLFHKYLV